MTLDPEVGGALHDAAGGVWCRFIADDQQGRHNKSSGTEGSCASRRCCAFNVESGGGEGLGHQASAYSECSVIAKGVEFGRCSMKGV